MAWSPLVIKEHLDGTDGVSLDLRYRSSLTSAWSRPLAQARGDAKYVFSVLIQS